MSRLLASILLAILALTTPRANESALVTAVDAVGMTVSDMDRAVDFYTRVLTFEKLSDVEVHGRPHELASGVFGARKRIVRLGLGGEIIELTEYLAPRGRPIAADVRPNDKLFQHVAIIVRDMDEAMDGRAAIDAHEGEDL